MPRLQKTARLGFEPRKCRIQKPVPYHLAIGQQVKAKKTGRVGIEPTNGGSKDRCLTTWLPANDLTRESYSIRRSRSRLLGASLQIIYHHFSIALELNIDQYVLIH